MSQITGTATIRIDGQEIRSLDGAVLSPGGFNRETKKGGGKVHGYSEEVMEPTLECKVNHTRDISLKYLSGITQATVLFMTDTGVQFILRNAWTTEPVSLDSSSGEVDLKMAAIECDEVL